MDIKNNIDLSKLPKRSFMFWFLAICTMLNNGMNGITYLFYGLFPKVMQQSVDVMRNLPMFSSEQYQEALNLYLSIAPWQYLLLFVAAAMAFSGALIMIWKLKPLGFHLYTISQILTFCTLNFIIGGKMAMNWSDIIWTICLVLIYALQMRYIQQIEKSENNNIVKDNDDNNNDLEPLE